MENKKCHICGFVGKEIKVTDNSSGRPAHDSLSINCPRCGLYIIDSLYEELPNLKLAAWIRDCREHGEKRINLLEQRDRILQSLPGYNVSEKQLKLLQNIERRTKYPGDVVKLNVVLDFPLGWAESEDEFRYLIRSLKERHLLEHFEHSEAEIHEIITPQGWDYLDKNRRNFEEKTQVFVAMSFSPKMNSVWENAIKPAIENAGYRPYRIDKELHSDRIDVKIMAEIKNSHFLVADVTEQKKGVYFEAGFALGLGLPVIWTIRNDDLNNVHFDTRQYNHILWGNETELKDQLYDYICAIIGKKSAVPDT